MKNKRIRSAKEALAESKALNQIWSLESRLTQRTLIYIAELLEKQNRLLKKGRASVPASRSGKGGRQ
jgi:hypothetical protein